MKSKRAQRQIKTNSMKTWGADIQTDTDLESVLTCIFDTVLKLNRWVCGRMKEVEHTTWSECKFKTREQMTTILKEICLRYDGWLCHMMFHIMFKYEKPFYNFRFTGFMFKISTRINHQITHSYSNTTCVYIKSQFNLTLFIIFISKCSHMTVIQLY